MKVQSLDELASDAYENRKTTSIERNLAQEPKNPSFFSKVGNYFRNLACAGVVLAALSVVSCEKRERTSSATTIPTISQTTRQAETRPKQDTRTISQEIYIAGFRFDPLVKEPDIPVELKTVNDTGYYIIQFKENPTKEQIKELRELGTVALKGVPKRAGVYRLDPAKRKQIKSLPYVRWVGIYQPLYKLTANHLQAYSEGKLSDETKRVSVDVFVFENSEEVSKSIASLGGDITKVAHFIRVNISETKLIDIARLTYVKKIESTPIPTLANDISVGIMEVNTTGWKEHGLTGAGQIVAVADTGLDTGNLTTLHEDFRGRVVANFSLGRPPNNWSDTNGHGTHITGSVYVREGCNLNLMRGAGFGKII